MIPKKYLNPKIWQLLVTRNMALFHAYLDNMGPLFWTKLYGLKVRREGLHLNHRGHVTIFFTERSAEKFRKAIERKIKTDPNFIKKLKTQFYKRGKHLLDITKKCSKDSAISINKSKNLLKKLFEAYAKLTPALGIGTILGRNVQAFLKESLKKENYPDQKIDRYISILTFPDKPSPARKEEIALLTLTSEIQKQTRKKRLSIKKMLKEKWIDQALDKHTENFGWIPVNFIDKSWDKKFFLSQLKNLLKHYDCQKLLRQREKSYGLSLKKRDDLFKKLKLSSQTKQYIKILRETAYLNEYRKSIFCQANLKMRPFLNRIAKRMGLRDWLECCYLLPKEIIKYLEKPSSKIKSLVKSRYEKYCLVGVSTWKEPRLCDKKELAYVLRNFKIKILEKKKIELKILKGSTGSLGKIKGKVKVVLVGKDIPKVKKDDILVAKMTSVDFIPAMKLASAFITDEGGITCHAAIVAREMNKPCVIGTKIATRVLKDGGRIEVDADKGIVKILKKR